MVTILALILSFFVGGPHVEIEKSQMRNPIESMSPVNPCAPSGCR